VLARPGDVPGSARPACPERGRRLPTKGGPGRGDLSTGRALSTPGSPGTPTENVPTPPDFADDLTLLSVEPPTASRPTLKLTAAGTGVRAVIELTLSAAEHLSATLRTISVAATAAADLEEDEH
jgi:hypothetical protein